MKRIELNFGGLKIAKFAGAKARVAIVLSAGFMGAVFLSSCAATSTAKNSEPKATLSSGDIAQYLKLTDIGFANDDARLPKKLQHLKDAAMQINAGNANLAAESLDKADALMPAEIADFSSWPLRDTLSCVYAPTMPTTTLTACAVQFETGKMTCGNPKAASLDKTCVAYYCESELYKESYSDPHQPYLTKAQMNDLQSANTVVNKICAAQ